MGAAAGAGLLGRTRGRGGKNAAPLRVRDLGNVIISLDDRGETRPRRLGGGPRHQILSHVFATKYTSGRCQQTNILYLFAARAAAKFAAGSRIHLGPLPTPRRLIARRTPGAGPSSFRAASGPERLGPHRSRVNGSLRVGPVRVPGHALAVPPMSGGGPAGPEGTDRPPGTGQRTRPRGERASQTLVIYIIYYILYILSHI